MAKLEVVVSAKNMLAKGLAGAKDAVSSFAGGVLRLSATIAKSMVAAGASVLGIGGYFVKAASDADETRTKFDAVFSGVIEKANRMAKELAASYGLAGSTSRKMLGDTGDLLVGFGFTEDAALDLAGKVNSLAVDLASFTNYSGGASGAAEALTKALLGETEMAKGLGIVIRQNTAEFRDSVAKKMAETGATEMQAKALATLDIAYQQSQKAQGDYARTQDGVSNRTRLVLERFKEFRESIGDIIIESGNLSEVLGKVANKIGEVTGKVTAWAKGGGFDKAVASLSEGFQRIINLRFEGYAAALTATLAALTVKIYALAKGSALLSTAINRASIAAAAKAVQLRLMGAAAAGATAKVIALKAAVLALQGLAFAGIAAGFAGIAAAAFRAGQAADQLNKTLAARAAFDAQAKGKWGVGADTMQTAREALQSGDTATIEKLDRLYPGLTDKVRAHWRELEKTATAAKTAEDAITGLGDATRDAAENAADFVGPQMPGGVEWLRKGEAIAAERAAEDAKKTADEIAQAKLDAAKTEEEIQNRLNAQREQAEQAHLEGLEREIGKREKLAGMTVDQFIAERRADKDREKAAEKEARRAKELQGRLDRHVKLSRKDQEFMDARNAIQKAKDEKKLLVEQADVAKNNLEQMEKAKQGASEATLDKLLTEQQAINEKLEKLLAQG